MNYAKMFLTVVLLAASQATSCMFFPASVWANEPTEEQANQAAVIFSSKYDPQAGPSINFAEIRAYEKYMSKMNMREYCEQKIAETQIKSSDTKTTKLGRDTQSIQTTPNKRTQFAKKERIKRYSL